MIMSIRTVYVFVRTSGINTTSILQYIPKRTGKTTPTRSESVGRWHAGMQPDAASARLPSQSRPWLQPQLRAVGPAAGWRGFRAAKAKCETRMAHMAWHLYRTNLNNAVHMQIHYAVRYVVHYMPLIQYVANIVHSTGIIYSVTLHRLYFTQCILCDIECKSRW